MKYYSWVLMLLFVNVLIAQEPQLVITSEEYNEQAGEITTNLVSFKVQDFIQDFSDAQEKYRFFWHFGDGEYLDTTGNHLNNIVKHHYSAEDETYDNIYVEVTKLYSENDPPKRYYFENDPTKELKITCTTACTSPIRTAPRDLIAIEINRGIVQGDTLVFIITFNIDSCMAERTEYVRNIYFEYDTIQFDVIDSSIDYDDTEYLSNTRAKRKWKSSNVIDSVGRRYGHIFMRAVVEPVLNVNDLVEIFVGVDAQSTCSTDRVTLDSNTAVVDLSHDPNDLTSPSDYVCMGDTTSIVEYEIKFENFGDGPADTVIIKDVIPEVYDLSTIKTVMPISQDGRVPPYTINGREIQWILFDDWLSPEDSLLRGTGEAGYEIYFPKEKTKGKLVFTIKYDTSFTPTACEAIVNQAEIIFDCNPSFYTNPHILDFSCTAYTLCPPCQRSVYLEEIPPIIANPGDSIDISQSLLNLPSDLQQWLDNRYQGFKWYPPLNINKLDTLTPTILATKTMDYYLIAYNYDPITRSNSASSLLYPSPCKKAIIRFPIQIDCNLAIEHNIGCTLFGGKRINAKVVGNYANESALIWQDCSVGKKYTSLYPFGLSQDSLMLSVKDTLTNCSVYLKIGLECDHLYFPYSDIGVIAGVLAFVVGGIIYFLRQRRR